jgi:hypothetical protein
MDAYVERFEVEGIIRGATREINQALAVEKLGSATTGNRKLIGELKKLNKHLRQMIGLKKQANVITATFYFCIISLEFLYILLISR